MLICALCAVAKLSLLFQFEAVVRECLVCPTNHDVKVQELKLPRRVTVAKNIARRSIDTRYCQRHLFLELCISEAPKSVLWENSTLRPTIHNKSYSGDSIVWLRCKGVRGLSVSSYISSFSV